MDGIIAPRFRSGSAIGSLIRVNDDDVLGPPLAAACRLRKDGAEAEPWGEVAAEAEPREVDRENKMAL